MPSVLIRLITLSFLPAVLLAQTPTFYRDVLPILQTHCQSCHRRGEIAPMAFDTYAHTRPFAAAIRERTRLRQMPPWFADPCCGHFSNDRSLSEQEMATLAAWAEAKAPAGDPASAPAASTTLTDSWNITKPDVVFSMPKPRAIPASGDIAYQYIIIPTHFADDKWVRMSEIRPSNRAVVHHAVAYVRPPDSKWLRGDPKDEKFTIADILLVYAPGSLPDQWPEGYAKLIPAGSDIVLQMHYTANGRASEDQTKIGLVFAAAKPEKRVITVQLTNDTFSIPPGDSDYRVEVHGSIPNDALLLSFFPHMHLRGKTFEYNIVQSHGRIRPLLRIPHYNFFWQLSYRLATPIPLKAGTILQAVATFDNSKNNPHNPDPTATVEWGEQTWAEMMVGFFDVAVDPGVDKLQFFVRH